jgi:hypothetical protein
VASIYESPGQQVALTGSQTGVSFQPVQAYDPSRMMLAQSEQDLRAFANFSESLTKFITDKAKEKNQQDLNLGIADILNGELTMNPNQMNAYKQNVKLLEQAADSEINAATQLAEVDPGAGETYRQQNRAISGWRAYGQAVGKAQMAASQAEGLLGSFLRDSQEVLTIRQPDGSIKQFTAAEAENEPELMAAYGVGLQKFMQTSGIVGLNPAILVEHLTPTMMRVRAKVIGERMGEITRMRQAAEQEQINIGVGQNLEGLANPESAQQILSGLLTSARQTFNGNWAQANQFVNDSVLSKLVALGAGNPEKASMILDSYSGLLLNPQKPELGTIYNRYAEEIEKARSSIKGSAREQAAEEEAEVKDEISSIYNTWRSASETGNLAESQRAFDAAEQELSKLAATYPEATEALSRMRQVGRNFNSLTEESVAKAVAGGSIKSRTELQLLAANGYISSDTANKLGEQLPEDDSAEIIKKIRAPIESFIRNQLRAQFKSAGIDFESFKDETNPLVFALTNELMESGLERMTELKATGKTTGSAQMQSYLQKEALNLLKTERFKPQPAKDKNGKEIPGKFVLPTPGRNLPAVVPYQTGPNGRDYSRQIINRLPPVVSAKRDVLLDAEKVQANIDALNNGGQPSSDLVTIAKASGLSVQQVLTQQAQKNGITYTPSSADKAAKQFQANSKLDPSAAQILANPRSTASQRIRATARLAEAKRRQQQTSMTTSSSGKAFGAGDYGGLAALISSGEGGFNSVNRGTAGDSPQGMNLTSMRIGDIQQLQRRYNETKGREGVFAVGFAQWVSDGQLDMAVKAAGLGPNDKMTPENQLKMFWAYILNSNKRPGLRDYLLGKNNDLLKAHKEMALEWAAVAGPEGYGYYDGDSAGNKASLGAKRVQQALREARKQIAGS